MLDHATVLELWPVAPNIGWLAPSRPGPTGRPISRASSLQARSRWPRLSAAGTSGGHRANRPLRSLRPGLSFGGCRSWRRVLRVADRWILFQPSGLRSHSGCEQTFPRTAHLLRSTPGRTRNKGQWELDFQIPTCQRSLASHTFWRQNLRREQISELQPVQPSVLPERNRSNGIF